MRKNIFIVISVLQLLIGSQSIDAQSYTFKHDSTKENQFLMQEVGTGSFQLQSEWYYDAFHKDYKNNLLSTNKQLYRSAAYMETYMQVIYADSIRKRLESRAKQEEFNIADRQVDLAWTTEQSKIETALDRYNDNLNVLASCQIDSEEMEDWKMYPKIWDFALSRTSKAYMANSERQKEYLTIYSDITKKNYLLACRIRYLKSLSGSQDILSVMPGRQKRFTECAVTAYNRWREAAWTTKANNNHLQNNK